MTMVGSNPAAITLQLQPRSRLDLIDVKSQLEETGTRFLKRFPRSLYSSHHTTAGYFEERLCKRLKHNRELLRKFVHSVQWLFPPEAPYSHDKMEFRTELTEQQRCCEPLNADSHLTFIGSGLANCATYWNHPGKPVYFVDLDGVYGETRRQRRTTVIGYNRETEVVRSKLEVPVSGHSIDSVNLKGLQVGLFEYLQELVDRHQVSYGRIDIRLADSESHAGLTVNEYETMLMKHDLTEVLRNPVRFVAGEGIGILGNPRAIPGKALNYARYDLVHLVNELVDALGLSESLLERMIDKFLAVPASRFLWMKRSLSLPVFQDDSRGPGSIIEGTYQSPILVQWKKAKSRTRLLHLRLLRFE